MTVIGALSSFRNERAAPASRRRISPVSVGERMIDHIILTVSDVERSLAFYETSLAPLNIGFFLPYKGENGHPDLWGFGDGKRAFLLAQAG